MSRRPRPGGDRRPADDGLLAAIDLGLGAGPIVLGLVAEGLGLPWVLGAGAAIALIGSAWMVALGRRN